MKTTGALQRLSSQPSKSLQRVSASQGSSPFAQKMDVVHQPPDFPPSHAPTLTKKGPASLHGLERLARGVERPICTDPGWRCPAPTRSCHHTAGPGTCSAEGSRLMSLLCDHARERKMFQRAGQVVLDWVHAASKDLACRGSQTGEMPSQPKPGVALHIVQGLQHGHSRLEEGHLLLKAWETPNIRVRAVAIVHQTPLRQPYLSTVDRIVGL